MNASAPVAPQRPPAVWLGDAVRVLVRLEADPHIAARVLALLGLRAAGAPPPPVDRGRDQRTGSLLASPPPGPPDVTGPTVREALRGLPPTEPDQGVQTPLVERFSPDPALSSVAPRRLPMLADVLDARDSGTLPGSTDLLPPGQQRTILSALCRAPAASGGIDVDELVERIARREPVRQLPLTAIPTTRRGVQVLVDFGDGMRPFVRDQREVVRALERLAGPDGFEVLRFAGTPLDPPGAGSGPVWTWRSYRPPLAGQPVVVLSDVGAGAGQTDRQGLEERWLAFAALLRAAGIQVVVLAPVPAHRLSNGLRAALPIVTWDRTARVADAVRAARRSAGRIQGRP